jgi:hypothetical protein
MSELKPSKMADHAANSPAILSGSKPKVADRLKTRVESGNTSEIASEHAEQMADLYPAKIATFVTPDKASELTGRSLTTVKRHCREGRFTGAHKALTDGIETWKIPVSSLPLSAQKKLADEVKAALVRRVSVSTPMLPSPHEKRLAPAEYRAAWDAFERAKGVPKRRAEAAHSALLAFHELVDAGLSVGDAEKAVAFRHGVSKPTLWRYRIATKDHPREHWLPLLMPRYKGGHPHAEFTQAAYEYILAQSLNTSETPLAVILETARQLGKLKGWVIPSYDAVRKRIQKEPAWLATVGRKGAKALERSYPAVEKDYASLELHELWESDGRKADVFCIWPDGSVARPFIIVWREVRSRLVLGVKGLRTPTAAGVLAAYGMALERAGVAPKKAKLDNGREYAAKSVSGGQANRYRFSVMPGEQPGVMTQTGTKAEWAKPGRGQDKPIESFWRFVADRCDKTPEFQGAYCGRNPIARPEDFNPKKAIPIAAYGAKLAAALEYFNNSHRHTGSGMDGRTPMEVYTQLFGEMQADPARRRVAVDPAHIRMCLMGQADVKPSRVDATYTLEIPGYGRRRFWSERISHLPAEVLNRKHRVYYDLEAPNHPVSIYDGQAYLGDAQPLEPLPFLGAGEQAAEHVKGKNEWMAPKMAAVKEIKARAKQLKLPALEGTCHPTELPRPVPEISIVDNRKQKTVLPLPTESAATNSDEEYLAELKRRRDEQRRKENPWLYRDSQVIQEEL